MDEKKQYWICIIGATNRENLKGGADSPMRNAVEEAFKKTVGHEDEICWSGWGSEKEKVDVMNAIWSMDKDDLLYIAIKYMLKGGNRL